MRPVVMRVGELAKRAGVSVRTLHHYEEIGLLLPSRRTEAGYRLYGDGEIARLQQIMSLRELGLSLEEVRSLLTNSDYSPLRVVELHIRLLREQVAAQGRLCQRLETLAEHLRSAEEVSAEEFSAEEFLQTIEVMSVVEKYCTPEQLEELRQRRETLGEERIRQAEAEWAELMEQVRAEMDKGTDPSDENVQRLARRWMELVQSFTSGNLEIESSLRKMWQQEETIHGIDTRSAREMGEYISKALTASENRE